MANYCTTKITLIGDNENLKKLYNKIDNRDFLNLESYPTLFENTENNSEFDWGSKWQRIDEICPEIPDETFRNFLRKQRKCRFAEF